MTPVPEIPAVAFVLLLFVLAFGIAIGWLAHRAFGKPKEIILASPRGEGGRFIRRPAHFEPPKAL